MKMKKNIFKTWKEKREAKKAKKDRIKRCPIITLTKEEWES